MHLAFGTAWRTGLYRHGRSRLSGSGSRVGADGAGVAQAEAVVKDPRLHGCQLIVSLPYTRALQTAAIIIPPARSAHRGGV